MPAESSKALPGDGAKALPAGERNENLATAVTEVSERVTLLIREEIELAKAETMQKVQSLAKGVVAFVLAAVIALYALLIALIALGWGLTSIFTGTADKFWIGFAIALGLLILLILGAALFGYRKIKVGPPTPDMAIDEAKKIRATVGTRPGA